MSQSDHSAIAIQLIAEAAFHEPDADRSAHSFIIQRPGEEYRMSGLGINIHYDEAAFTKAILYVRRHGAPYLGSLSFSDVRSLITDFVASSFYLVSNEIWGAWFSESFRERLSEKCLTEWGQALANSRLFIEPRELTLFPLTVIRCEQPFLGRDFFMVGPEDLTPKLIGSVSSAKDLIANQFPPFRGASAPPKPVSSWLGIWAPNFETAKRLRATVLGALALTPHSIERYLFTMRKVVSGRCTLIGPRYSISIGDPHTPGLSEDIVLVSEDAEWLNKLDHMLTSPKKDHRRRMRALEYQYRAWAPDPAKRFPSLVGAIDAIFGGDGNGATQAVVDAVGPLMGKEYDSARIRMLLGLRGSVIHGGAPNVYESSSYRRYYETYHEDAVRDLEMIVAKCLQHEVFGEDFRERPFTYADLLDERRRKGM